MTQETVSEELVIHATKAKETKNYIKYIPQTEEDPPEFLPNTAIYLGKHLTGIKRIVIELSEEGE